MATTTITTAVDWMSWVRVGQLTLRSSTMTSRRKRDPRRSRWTAFVTVPAFSCGRRRPSGGRRGARALDGLVGAAGLGRARAGGGRRVGRPAVSASFLSLRGSDSRHQLVITCCGRQGRRDSNPQPPVLETGALPVELRPFAGGPGDQGRLTGLLVRRVASAPSAEFPELDPVRRVPPALHGLVVPTLAFLASHRHSDALTCRHRWQPSVRGRATCRVPHALRPPGRPDGGSNGVAAGPAEARGGRLGGHGLGPGRGAEQAGGGALEVDPGLERDAGPRPRVSARRRYSVTSGGRARALGDPAERTRWQRACTASTVRLGRRILMATPPRQQEHLAVRSQVDHERGTAAAETELNSSCRSKTS